MERPISRKLYRQSSIEMHLQPADPDLSDEDTPKIVGILKKDKTKIKNDLENILKVVPKKKNVPNILVHKNSVLDFKEPLTPRRKVSAPVISAKRVSQGDYDNVLNDVLLKPEDIKRRCSLGSNSLENSEYSDSSVHKSDSAGNLVRIMASPRPKSPKTPVTKTDKEESFWDKIGTLGRKKRIKEVQEVQAEGKYAIDSPGSPMQPEMPPEEYELDDNEERSMLAPHTLDEPRVRELITVLIDWINDEMASQRIIVKDLEEDLYDGQVLQKLLEKLTGEKLDVPEVTQSEDGQRHKLSIVLAAADRVLGVRYGHSKWSVESVHSKNIVAILYLLVALARHFRAPVRLPENVSLAVLIVQKVGGQIVHRTQREQITETYDDVGMRCERDAFDTLFDHAPDKLQVVKKSLVTFVNKHLNKVNFEVNELDTQFHDGVYLTLLMGLLEGFFVPLHCFHSTPHDFDHKVHNVAFAFELMQDVGLPKPKARPEDIVNKDLKSTLRVLYNLFMKYKNIS